MSSDPTALLNTGDVPRGEDIKVHCAGRLVLTNPPSPTMSEVETTTPISDSDKWTEGDFTIISSNGVRFKAPSRSLLYYR